MCAARPLPALLPRPILRAAWVAVLNLAFASQTGDAAARPNRSFELEWSSPPSCPQQLDVTEQIRAMLGAAPGASLPSGLRAKGIVELVDERFHLTLSVRVGQVERSRIIASDDCTSLGKAAAVVLGLLIRREHESGRALSDSDLGSDFAQPAAPTEPRPRALPPNPPAKPREQVVPSQTHDASNQRSWHLLAMLPTATADYFTLPKPAYGIGIALGATYNAWRWFASGTLWRAQRVAQGGIEAYETTFARKSFETWVCRGWRSGAYEISPCALAAIDVLSVGASGDRLTTEQRRIVLVSPGAGLVGFLHLTERVGLFLSLTGRVALLRPKFEVRAIASTDQAHSVPWATTLTSIGTEWIF